MTVILLNSCGNTIGGIGPDESESDEMEMEMEEDDDDPYQEEQKCLDTQEEKQDKKKSSKSHAELEEEYRQITIQRNKIKKQYREEYRMIFYTDSECITINMINQYADNREKLRDKLEELDNIKQQLKEQMQEESSESSSDEEDLFSREELQHNKEIASLTYDIGKLGLQIALPDLKYTDIIEALTNTKTETHYGNHAKTSTQQNRRKRGKAKRKKKHKRHSRKQQYDDTKGNKDTASDILDIVENIVGVLTDSNDKQSPKIDAARKLVGIIQSLNGNAENTQKKKKRIKGKKKKNKK